MSTSRGQRRSVRAPLGRFEAKSGSLAWSGLRRWGVSLPTRPSFVLRRRPDRLERLAADVPNSRRLYEPLLLSFQVSLLATLIAGACGVILAGLLAQRRFRGARLVDAILNAPLVLPPTVLGYYLLVVVGRESVLGRAYEAATGSPIVFTRSGAVFAAALAALPFVARSARAALDSVELRFTEAAATLGAPPLRAFVRVRMPLAARGILAGLTLGFARSLGDFGVTLMVAGNIPHRTQTASLAIYDALQAGRDGQASALAAVLTSLAILALYTINRLSPGPAR